MESGADLIETATYQLSLPALCSYAGVDEEKGKKVMQSALSLPRSAFGADQTSGSHRGTVLSIGPFGATLSPGQEYAGIYPPPYGPSTQTNHHTDAGKREESVSALEKFHLDRLRIYAEDKEAWEEIKWIAFETIPVLAEYEAIRRAMTSLKAEGIGKPFWITSAFPDGLHGQQVGSAGGERANVRDILLSALCPCSSSSSPSSADLVPALGVGINCTNPSVASTLSEEYTRELTALRKEDKVRGKGVTFVMYPDGGCLYDVHTRSWSSGQLDPKSWGTQLATIAREVEKAAEGEERIWEGVIVGGCCKAGFEDIKALRDALDRE